MELLATGLQIDTLDEIIAEMDAALLAGIATTLNLQAPDPIAVMTDVVAERLSSLEELSAALYSGMQPDNASGDQLEGIALITGTTRQPANKTLVNVSITVDAAFTALAGTMFASVVGVPNVLYTNVDDFSAVGAGTTTGVGFECVDTGENVVNASTLTVIAAALTHWTAITNPSAGVTGLDIQTDASLRVVRQQELALGGSTSAAAIAADIRTFIQPSQSPLTIPGIQVGESIGDSPFTITAGTISVKVLDSETAEGVAAGLPDNSIEVIAYNGGVTDAEGTNALCALIFADKAAGIATYSGQMVALFKTITDDQGVSEDIYYTRPTAVPTNISLTVTQRSGYTVTALQIKDAIATYALGTDFAGTAVDGAVAHWTPGATAYASSIVGAVFEVEGVADVTLVVLSAANVGANVVPTVRQIVTLGTITPTIA